MLLTHQPKCASVLRLPAEGNWAVLRRMDKERVTTLNFITATYSCLTGGPGILEVET